MFYIIETHYSWVILWWDNGIQGSQYNVIDAPFFDIAEYAASAKMDVFELETLLQESIIEREIACILPNPIDELLESMVGVIPRIRELAFRDWNDILTYDMDTLFPNDANRANQTEGVSEVKEGIGLDTNQVVPEVPIISQDDGNE